MSIFKSKFLLGVMIVAVMFVGVFALTSAAKADDSCAITSTLKLGMKGTEVTCLQQKLNVTPATGYFGTKTKKAVMDFQTKNELKADGIVGKTTRAALTVGTTAATTDTTTAAVALCPNGNTLASNCATAPAAGTVTTTGTTTATGTTDGSITGSTSSYVSYGIQLKKGDSKDIVAERLQAVAGPVKVTRVVVDLSVRPWLFFSQLSLHDSAGKVIATKVLTDSTTSTEVTVGSDYQVIFDNLNYVVTPGTNVDLVVGASVLPATDKITDGMTVNAAITNIRTLSEVGYSDTVQNVAPSLTGGNQVTLKSTGSVADIYSRISPNSPLTGQQVVSTTQTTSNVTLGIFSVKSANDSSTLNTLAVNINYVPGTGAPALASAFSNYRLFINGTSVAGGVLSGTTVTFSNMTAPLAQDTWVDLSIEADINATTATTSSTVQLTLNATAGAGSAAINPIVTDANYGNATSEGGTPTSNVLTLTANSINVTNAAVTNVTSVNAGTGGSLTGFNATYGFTITNNSNTDLYVSGTPSTFVTTTVTGSAGATGTLTSVTASTPSTVSEDTTAGIAGATQTVYAIPAGTARTFNFSAALRASVGGNVTLKISQVNYGLSAGTPTGLSTTSNLSNLTLTESL